MQYKRCPSPGHHRCWAPPRSAFNRRRAIEVDRFLRPTTEQRPASKSPALEVQLEPPQIALANAGGELGELFRRRAHESNRRLAEAQRRFERLADLEAGFRQIAEDRADLALEQQRRDGRRAQQCDDRRQVDAMRLSCDLASLFARPPRDAPPAIPAAAISGPQMSVSCNLSRVVASR